MASRVECPLFQTLFFGCAAMNLSGRIPYSFTVTSHVAVTLGMTFSLRFGAALAGVLKYQERLFERFLPPSLPRLVVPRFVGVEMLGFLSRAVSLGVRLSANMLAGHSLLSLVCTLV